MKRRTSKVSERAKRGYTFNDKANIYVRNGYDLVPCKGEAHANCFIDNCWSCMSGTWGWMLVSNNDVVKEIIE